MAQLTKYKQVQITTRSGARLNGQIDITGCDNLYEFCARCSMFIELRTHSGDVIVPIASVDIVREVDGGEK